MVWLPVPTAVGV
jgi:hypothetical protein